MDLSMHMKGNSQLMKMFCQIFIYRQEKFILNIGVWKMTQNMQKEKKRKLRFIKNMTFH